VRPPDLRHSAQVAQTAGPSRAAATEGVRQRLDTTLHAYPGLRLEPVPVQFLRSPETPPGGHRILRGGRLPDGDDEVFEVVAELWREAGSRVEDVAGLDGRILEAHDLAGYVVTLARHGLDDPILTVASPPIPVPFLDRGLLLGLATGLAVGCLGPCAAQVGPSAVAPFLASYWGWLPLFALIVGCCLWFPETRRFGAGLAVTGALVGITIAVIFSG
jgi:hypothetical protein